MALPSVLRPRRDTNQARRPGYGRQTTKRSFQFQLPSRASLLGRRAQLASKEANGDAQVNFEHLWRNSIETAPAADKEMALANTATVPSPVALATPTPATPVDEMEGQPATGEPTPFRRANKLMRTPAGGLASGDEEEVRQEHHQLRPRIALALPCQPHVHHAMVSLIARIP